MSPVSPVIQLSKVELNELAYIVVRRIGLTYHFLFVCRDSVHFFGEQWRLEKVTAEEG